MNYLRKYLEAMDGLRSWYEQWPRTRPASAFVAASLLAFIGAIFLFALIVLIDLLFANRYGLIEWLNHHRLAVGACALLLVFANTALAKKSGIYDRVGPPVSPTWTRPFVGIIVVVAAVTIAVAVFASIRGTGFQ